MSTTTAPRLDQVPANDLYDPEEVFPRNSPLLQPLRPNLRPDLSSESPSPSPSPSPVFRNRRLNQGYAVLISHLDGHRQETSAYAEIEPPPSDPESDDCPPGDSEPRFLDNSPDDMSITEKGKLFEGQPGEDRSQTMSVDSPDAAKMGALTLNEYDLTSLAADALKVVSTRSPQSTNAGPTPPVTEHDTLGDRHPTTTLPGPMSLSRVDPLRDERTAQSSIPSPALHSPRGPYSSLGSGIVPTSSMSPPANTQGSHSEGLPPLQLNSPKPDASNQILPSIRSQLGDISRLGSSHSTENGIRGAHPNFGSPPSTITRLPTLAPLTSPRLPSVDSYRDPLSPIGPPIPGPAYSYAPINGPLRPDTQSTQRPSTAMTASGADRTSTHAPSQTGAYKCTYPGCNAPPFQTQYLLNSHANVHSSERPHYCPVPGCPRSEGGKGFKRKNEMIRHGLVHQSPGYICPFCSDREHKYPRPDNLQR